MLSKLVKFSSRISSNLKSSINPTPSSVSQIVRRHVKRNGNRRNGCRKRSFKCTPEANPKDPWDVTFYGLPATRNYLSQCIRARAHANMCMCVCRSRSLRIPEFSVFEKSTETTVTALVIRDS